jgi:hypothetical protein
MGEAALTVSRRALLLAREGIGIDSQLILDAAGIERHVVQMPVEVGPDVPRFGGVIAPSLSSASLVSPGLPRWRASSTRCGAGCATG